MSEKEGKKKNMQALQKRYSNRFTYTRLAREAYKEGDFITAIKNYNEYLKTMGDIHDMDPLELVPEIFNPEKELSELLLVSQIYWELTKIYDMTPKLQKEFNKVLDQFIVFTINQPFQVVNAELLRKYMRNLQSSNYEDFRAAYDKIFIESNKCYVSTYCFGNEHDVTRVLRKFKNHISSNKIGLNFIKTYYYLSPKFLEMIKGNKLLINSSRMLLIPIIYTIYAGLKVFIK